MRVLLFIFLLLSVLSCSEHLVETNQSPTIYEYKIGSDHEVKIVGDKVTTGLANSMSQLIEERLSITSLVMAESKAENEKSWGDIEFIPSKKKKGYFWNQIGANNITYQSYAVHYNSKQQSDTDMILVHQFPVNNNKTVAPFLFEAYDLSTEGWQMSCVRARLYGQDAKFLSKKILMQNELRVFGTGPCAFGATGFTEVTDLTWD